MRQFLTCLFFFFSAANVAQHNVFLDRDYWKSSPDVARLEADIAKGNNPSESNSNGFDAVVYAINENAPNETVRQLLAQPGNGVNKLTHDGRTYIFWAAYKGNTELMEYLLTKGAKTDILDDHGYTVANFAAANGQRNTKVYDICIANGANLKKDVDHNGANALLLSASSDKNLELFKYFTAKGLSIKSTDAKGNTVLNYAAKAGDIPTMDALLKKGAKFTSNAMIFASQGTRSTTNTLEAYRYLESKGVKPNAIGTNGENALHAIARKSKGTDIIEYFLSKGVDVNQTTLEGNNVLMSAALNPSIEVLNLLVSKTQNINQVNAKGASALLLAIQYNSPDAVKLLLSRGSDINIVDKDGNGVLHYLAQSHSVKKTQEFDAKMSALEQLGFALSKPQKNGNTLFHIAVAKNDLELLRRAAEAGIDINAKNGEGLTALHKAAMTAKNDETLKFLISKGAKRDAVTDMQETAFDLASENEAFQKHNISLEFLKS